MDNKSIFLHNYTIQTYVLRSLFSYLYCLFFIAKGFALRRPPFNLCWERFGSGTNV